MGFGGAGAEGVGKVLSEAGKDSRTEFKVSRLAVPTWGTACCALGGALTVVARKCCVTAGAQQGHSGAGMEL